MMMRNLSHCLNGRHQTSVAIGTLKNSVAHAFCASWYGSCLFRPVILSLNLKLKQRVDYVFAFCAWRRLDWGAEIH